MLLESEEHKVLVTHDGTIVTENYSSKLFTKLDMVNWLSEVPKIFFILFKIAPYEFP